MNHRVLTSAGFVGVLVTVLVACADDGNREVPAATEDIAPTSRGSEFPAPICPGPASEHPAGWYHQKATRVAAYVLGGADPFGGETANEEKDVAACRRAHACATKIRAEVAAGLLAASSGDAATTSCGVSVSTFTLTAASDLSDVDFDDAAWCAAELDACWGNGVSGFFLSERAVRERKLHIDPEPADLKAPLANSTGSTAPAIYVYSQTPTTVLTWPASFMPGYAAAGTPCENYGLPAGYRATKIIYVQGTLRRCM